VPDAALDTIFKAYDVRGIYPDEIDEVFAVPIPALAHPNLVEEREVLLNGRRRTLRLYHVGRHVVWGVTARILQNLLERLGLGDERWHGEGLE